MFKDKQAAKSIIIKSFFYNKIKKKNETRKQLNFLNI